MPRKADPPKPATVKRGRGRPRSTPDGAYQQSYLASRAEHEALRELLRCLRTSKSSGVP